MRVLFGWTLTLRLWRALWGRIPGHPLMAVVKTKRPASSEFGCSPLLIGAMLVLALPVMWVVGFTLALIAVVVGGTIRGAAAAALTARGVYHERGIGRLDLLGLTPAGTLGTGWALALREFRLSAAGQFANRYIQNAQRIIGIGAVAMVSLITLGTLIFQFDGVADVAGDGITPALEYVLGAVQLVAVTLIWLFTDNAQSPLIGTLVGIWTGLHARRKPEAAGMAAALYAIPQMALFAAAIVVWNAGVGLPDGLRLGLVVALMMCAREALLRALWRQLCRDVNATGAELPAVLRL